MEQKSNSGGGYGRRPLWQWILLYVVVGGILYGVIYYFVFGRNGGGYNSNTNTPSYTPTPAQSDQSTPPPQSQGVYPNQ